MLAATPLPDGWGSHPIRGARYIWFPLRDKVHRLEVGSRLWLSAGRGHAPFDVLAAARNPDRASPDMLFGVPLAPIVSIEGLDEGF